MSHCGECTMCCTLMAVEELNKPRCVTCTHVDGHGCGIYVARPQSCREFECIWLQTQKTTSPWPKRLRPDKCGVMFTPTTKADAMAAHGNPENLRRSPLAERVKLWLGNGLKIVVVHGDKTGVMFWRDKNDAKVVQQDGGG